MKKWILAIVIPVVLAIAGIYVLIPAELSISAVGILNSSANGAFRSMSKEDKWFPATIDSNKYTVTKVLVYTFYISIKDKEDSIASILQLLPFANDSTGVQWKCTIRTSDNPVSRIQRYKKAVAIKAEMEEIIQHLNTYVSNTENIYGLHIERTSFTDTLLLTTKSTFTHYPSVADSYQLINSLKQHAAQKMAVETGVPLQNITPLDSSKFQLMVALPVNKVVADSGKFFFRRMIPAAFMKAEVKGGPHTIKEAMHQMQLYFSDYRRTAMAIPFEYIVTDRIAETDTSKWITRIYAPVY